MDISHSCHELVEHCPLPMFISVGEAHILVDANPAFCRLCDQTKETMIGSALQVVLERYPYPESLLALMDRIHQKGEPEVFVDAAPYPTESGMTGRSYVVWTIPDASGQPATHTVLILGGPALIATDHNGQLTNIEMREINQALLLASLQQHELAEKSRNIANSLVKSEEHKLKTAVFEERNRIAREIHDTLAQAFTGILLQLRVAQRIAAQRPDDAWEIIEHVCELAQQGLAETRRSVWDLQPEMQKYGDLVNALTLHIDQVAVQTGVRTELYIHGEQRSVPPNMGLNLLRIAQESINNAIRHGEAGYIWLGLTFDTSRVVLRIQDDGKGFDATHQANGGGFGLIGMGQRADRLGGELKINSHLDKGTEVTVSIPFATAQNKEI